jgi:hypothetical protein
VRDDVDRTEQQQVRRRLGRVNRIDGILVLLRIAGLCDRSTAERRHLRRIRDVHDLRDDPSL